CIELLLLSASEHDRRAVPGKPLRDPLSNAAAAAGDEGSLSVEKPVAKDAGHARREYHGDDENNPPSRRARMLVCVRRAALFSFHGMASRGGPARARTGGRFMGSCRSV